MEHPLQVLVFYHLLVPRRIEGDSDMHGESRDDFQNRVPDHLLDHLRHGAERGRERHHQVHGFFLVVANHLVDESQGIDIDHRELRIVDGLELLDDLLRTRYLGIHGYSSSAQRIKPPAG